MRGRERERVSQLIVHLDPRSPVAEAYRTIRAGVLSMAHKRDLKVLGITSPIQGEGKSMTSANIAAALGQTDKRVLVISADMRKPRIHEFFGAANDVGLSNVLEGELPFSEAVERADGGIWVLAGGTFPTRPAELLQSPAMAELLAAARKQFDFVIVDCPPVLGLADCLAVLPLVDAVLLVVQADKTHGGAILEVGDRLERVGVAVDAVVMNDVRVSRGGPGHRSYGYYVASEDYLRPVSRPRLGSLRLPHPEPPLPSRTGRGGPRRSSGRSTRPLSQRGERRSCRDRTADRPWMKRSSRRRSPPTRPDRTAARPQIPFRNATVSARPSSRWVHGFHPIALGALEMSSAIRRSSPAGSGPCPGSAVNPMMPASSW